jgi:hypothetical protein
MMMAKELQTTTEIPPLKFQDYPVDINIRIFRDGARYAADILGVGSSQHVPIEMSPHDLETLNTQLQKAMLAVANSNPEQVGSENENLRSLAELGHWTFKQIFGHRDAFFAIQELLNLSTQITMQIVTEDFFLPWELLYSSGLEEPLSYANFWGMKYIISRIIVQRDRSGAFVSPMMASESRPKIGLLLNSQLPGVLTKETPFFEELDDNDRIVLSKLRALDPVNKIQEFGEFRKFLSNDLQIAHFACHALYDNIAPNLSYIQLSNEFPISLQDMEVYGIVLQEHPLVVLNACETGNLNPLYTSSFVRTFLKYGARGVVATECPVPDSFAADFTEYLYRLLLTGMQLGESILSTRRHFLEMSKDPSGLLYSMYASPSIRFRTQ